MNNYTDKQEVIEELVLTALLLMGYRDSFKESQVGYSTAQNSIDFIDNLRKDLQAGKVDIDIKPQIHSNE